MSKSSRSGYTPVNYLVYCMVRLFIAVAQAAPMERLAALARLLSWLAYDVIRVRRGVIDENLRHAFPAKPQAARETIARGMWEHLALMLCEVAHMPRKIHETNWRRHVRATNVEPAVWHLLQPRPHVILVGHFGNFEVGGVMAGLFGFPTHTIARPLDNPYLDRFLKRFRGGTGQYILPKEGSAPEVARLLENNGTLALLGDQYAGSKGCWVDFFGRPASCHKAIAVFSLTTDAPMLVSYTRRLGKPMQFEFAIEEVYDPQQTDQPMTDIRTITQWYSHVLERIITRDPAQYWWVHRRWKDTRGKKRKKERAKALGVRRAA